ncbi:enhanced serine sensitivity protein SseB C-terminal domain-containing protein [Pedobacter sp. L105]|uniref:enhanced serine sensitivity protein SseB C-terminal domain-containing protein n=1 Tax=Pedobacter sp. L105 TaxID=1641871 RepID=UPI00131CA764|nr:enhanced serine sensitivity protein SseB C-terminal domain-containing protein [Pedobacter sp. L105]
MNKNYIESLISFFSSNPAVLKAYFGLLYNEQDNSEDLFLAVVHHGDLDNILIVTESLKQQFLANRQVSFTSSAYEPELLSFIEQTNAPFYALDEPKPLHVAIMKYWFEPEKYRKEFINQVTTGRLRSLFKDFNPMSNALNFQTYVKDGREFIPLFSDKDMIGKSGMTTIPPDLTVVEFDWVKVDELLDGKLRENFYVLNPGTSFGIEFTLL